MPFPIKIHSHCLTSRATIGVIKNSSIVHLFEMSKKPKSLFNNEFKLSPTQFRAIVKLKGWNYKKLADWWGVTPTWIGAIAKDPERSPHFDDAIMGLPYRRLLQSTLAKRQQLADSAKIKPSKQRKVHTGGLRYRDYFVVGAVVNAIEDVGSLAPSGMRGVVFGVRLQGKSEEYGVIFENGSFDWFPPDFVDVYLSQTGLTDQGMTDYKFQSTAQLEIDYAGQLFDFWP